MLQIIIGVLGIIVAIMTLGLGNFMNGAMETSAQQQALTSLKVAAVLGLLSSIFNFGCGYCGLKGAKGDRKKLSTAVKLGWLGLGCCFSIRRTDLIWGRNRRPGEHGYLKQCCAGIVPDIR